MRETLSVKLFNVLQRGKGRLGNDALKRIAGFVDSQRADDDSFVNKSGIPDLYYTMFGWMLSYILGVRLDAKKTDLYLSAQQADSLDIIHYAAFMRCRIIQRLIEGGRIGLLLNSFFSSDIRKLTDFNGFPHNDPQSPYTQFIWLSLLEDTGRTSWGTKFVNKKKILQSLTHYHLPDGGFMNVTDGLTATTNATVAALAVIGQLDGYTTSNKDASYLRSLQESSGGFSAAKWSPVPDLLSTSTSLFILNCYGLKPKYSAKEFIDAHWLDSGGFSATILEEKSDVEYTFYGLLALGAIGED